MLGIPIGITSSAVGLKMCAINAGSKKYKLIIKKREKSQKIVFLAKFKLNKIEVLISKTLINSNISCDEYALIINVLKKYDDMKEEIKKFKDFSSLSKVLFYL